MERKEWVGEIPTSFFSFSVAAGVNYGAWEKEEKERGKRGTVAGKEREGERERSEKKGRREEKGMIY